MHENHHRGARDGFPCRRPFVLKSLRFRNRSVIVPMTRSAASADVPGTANKWLIERIGREEFYLITADQQGQGKRSRGVPTHGHGETRRKAVGRAMKPAREAK